MKVHAEPANEERTGLEFLPRAPAGPTGPYVRSIVSIRRRLERWDKKLALAATPVWKTSTDEHVTSACGPLSVFHVSSLACFSPPRGFSSFSPARFPADRHQKQFRRADSSNAHFSPSASTQSLRIVVRLEHTLE